MRSVKRRRCILSATPQLPTPQLPTLHSAFRTLHYRLPFFRLVLLALTLSIPSSLQAQSINPKILSEHWQAQWIRAAGQSGPGVYLFRRSFDLAATPERFVVHASADQRYELFVNGQSAGTTTAPRQLEQNARKYIGAHAETWWQVQSAAVRGKMTAADWV